MQVPVALSAVQVLCCQRPAQPARADGELEYDSATCSASGSELTRARRPGCTIISILKLKRRCGVLLVGNEDKDGVAFVAVAKEVSVDMDMAR
jgi:hypothetical protein